MIPRHKYEEMQKVCPCALSTETSTGSLPEPNHATSDDSDSISVFFFFFNYNNYYFFPFHRDLDLWGNTFIVDCKLAGQYFQEGLGAANISDF